MKIILVTILFFSSVITAEENGKFQSLPFSELACIGTEPYWSLDVDSHKAVFEDLDENKESLIVKKVIQSSNHTNRWFLTLKSEAKNNTSVLAIHRTGVCSDDMSDFQYDYEMMLLSGDSVSFSGCCNRLD